MISESERLSNAMQVLDSEASTWFSKGCLLQLAKSAVIANCASLATQCSRLEFQYHQGFLRNLIFTANVEACGRCKAKAGVIFWMT